MKKGLVSKFFLVFLLIVVMNVCSGFPGAGYAQVCCHKASQLPPILIVWGHGQEWADRSAATPRLFYSKSFIAFSYPHMAYLDPIFGMKMKIFKSVEPHHNEIISAGPFHLNYQKHF